MFKMSVMPPYLENKDEDSDSQESYVDINAEINDWDLPIVLDEPRHNEPIKGEERVEQSWRLKEKVGGPSCFHQKARKCVCC